MPRSSSPSLAINNIPPDVLERLIVRSRAEGWVSKNQLLIELMRKYAEGEVALPAPPPIADSNAALMAQRNYLPLHGKMLHVDDRTWVLWVQGFTDERPQSGRMAVSLKLQAVGAPARHLRLRVTREGLVEHGTGNIDWILDALRTWVGLPAPPEELSL